MRALLPCADAAHSCAGRNRNRAGLIVPEFCFQDVFFLDAQFPLRANESDLQATLYSSWDNRSSIGGNSTLCLLPNFKSSLALCADGVSDSVLLQEFESERR